MKSRTSVIFTPRRRASARTLRVIFLSPSTNIYPGDANIQLVVPTVPMSRDLQCLDSLRRAIAVYRMDFGQPRQDNLL